MNDLIPLGVLITIEPLPVIGFILVLSTDRGTRNGAAFIAAWVVTIVGIVVATLALTGGEPVAPASAPATASYVVQLVLGLVLLGVAVERLLHPRPEPPPAPGWARRLDGMRAGGAALVGFLLQPWALVAAAAADVLQADLSKAATVAQLVVFSLVATSSLLAMQIYSMTNPDRARATLDALRQWIDRHRNRAITVLAVVVGLWLATKGVIGLVGQS